MVDGIDDIDNVLVDWALADSCARPAAEEEEEKVKASKIPIDFNSSRTYSSTAIGYRQVPFG